MIAKIIDGKDIASKLLVKVKLKVKLMQKKFHTVPGLAVIMMGKDPASQIYVKNKMAMAKEVGMNAFLFDVPEKTSEKILLRKIELLTHDPKVNGILVQLPLPKHISAINVVNTIPPEKDVDGFHPENFGKLVLGIHGLYPCTPQGCMHLLKSVVKDLKGKKAIVIGRSNIVGKPMAQLLLREDCTVTMAHSKTKNLQEECRQADIIVSAVGKPQFITKDYVKKGAVVIDVGISRVKDRIVGDVDFNQVKEVAGAITPVPGGVGPMTISYLLNNTLKATMQQRKIDEKKLMKNE